MEFRREFRIPSETGFVVFDNEPVAPSQEADFLALLRECWLSLLADSPCDPLKPNRVLRSFYKRLLNDPHGTIRDYSQLMGQVLTDPASLGGSLHAFKHTPIFREAHAFIRTQDPNLFRYIYSFLTFGKKTYFPGNEALEAAALRSWLEIEDNMSVDAPPAARNLRHVLSGLARFSPEQFFPAHGPGYTATEGVGRDAVWKSAVLSELPGDLRRFFVYDHPELWADFPPPLPFLRYTYAKTSGPAKLTFVPKDYKSMRSICMEPVEKQFFQQGYRVFVEECISQSAWSKFIDFSDQKLNQEASEFGSKTGLVDTLDLSAASDRLSWELVLAIFPRNWLSYMHVTRSTKVKLPDGSVRPIRKYAPMGSSLCFPTQSLVYAAIVLTLYIAQAYGRDWEKDDLSDIPITEDTLSQVMRPRYTTTDLRNRFQPFRAYGDDIILDCRVSSRAVGALEYFGFKVNVGKSFFGSHPFRESCGAHHLYGRDVTPFQHKAKYFEGCHDPSSLVSVVEHANNALEYGYLRLRKAYIRHALHYPIQGKLDGVRRAIGVNPLLFSSYDEESETIAIRSFYPKNAHLRGWKGGFRHSPSLQRPEVKALALHTEDTNCITFDDVRHNLYWRSRQRNSGMGLMESPIKLSSPEHARFALRFVAV